MAVNTQKLLSGSGTLSTKTSRIAVSSGSKEKGGALVRSDRGALSRDILQMKTRVLKLQGVVESNRKENQKEQDVKRRNEEKEERKKREKKLEAKPGLKGIGLPNVVANLPGGSIVDAIKRYLGFTLLGWLVGKYNELGPKLEGFMKVAKPAFEGLVFATESILKGVYTFVETGYKAYDTINAGIKKLGGVGAEKTFNEFSGHLNKLLNGAIIASMLIISTAPKGPKKGPTGSGSGYQAGFAAGYAAGLASRGKGPRYRPSGAAAAGRTFEENLGRQTLTRERMLSPTGPQGPLDRIGRSIKGAGAQLQTGTLFKRGAGIQKALYNVPGKIKGVIPKGGPGFGRFPVIGPLITFTIRTLVYREAPQKAAAAAVGMGIGQAIGTFIGGLGAGALGLGTAGLGAIVAPLIIGAGSVIGGLVGEWIGAALYDAISKMFSKKTTGRANGGSIGSARTTPRSSIKRSLPPRKKILPQTTSPGKDVGGKKAIEEFYGSEKIKTTDPRDIEKTRGQKTVRDLEKISNQVKKLPVDWVASIGGAYVDMTLGQKPDPNLAGSVARSFGQFIEGAMNSQISATTAEITKAFVGMASGGIVPETKPGEVSKKVSDNIEKRLQEVFNKSSLIALTSIKSQSFLQEDIDKIESGDGTGGGAGGGGGTDIDKITMGAFSQEDIDALGRMIAAEAGNQPKLGKAGVLSVILNRYRLAKSGDRGYMPDGKNKNNVTLKDILYDTGQFAPIKDGRFDRTSSAAGKNALADAIAASGNDPKKFKEKLIKELRLSETDAETVVRATAFSNPRSRSVKPFDTPEVSVGNHSFQESPYSRVGSFPGAISANVIKLPLGIIPKADYVKGVLDESGEPGFDVTWKGTNNIAVLPGKVKEKGMLYGSGYGNVVVVESVDPVTNRKVDVLYAHFPDGGTSVNVGDVVKTGQVLGRMGKPGEPGIGNITGQHASIDFYEPNSKPGQLTGRYSRWMGLSREVINAAQSGRNPSTWPKPEPVSPQPSGSQARQASITQALASKGAIPVTYAGQKFFFQVNPNGSIGAFKSKNFLGIQEPIDIGGNKNKGLRDAINAKVQSMYGKPQPGPTAPGYGKQKGGATLSSSQPKSSISSLSRSGSLNMDTSDTQVLILRQTQIVYR